VGDLDRVIQVNDPPSVAAFLQRTGRTGTAAGEQPELPVPRAGHRPAVVGSRAAAPVGPGIRRAGGWAPPEPRHIVAQQLLALCLQEHRIGSRLWVQAWNALVPFDRSAEAILRHLIKQGFIDQDGELLFIGPTAEQAVRVPALHGHDGGVHRPAAVHRAGWPAGDRADRPDAAH